MVTVCQAQKRSRILPARIETEVTFKVMPIYEFRCKKCDAHLEVFQKFSDKQPSRCRKCGGRLEKLISAPAVQFKGEGWYVTDYARKGTVAEKVEKELSSSESSSSGDKSESGSSDKDKAKKSPAKKSDKG